MTREEAIKIIQNEYKCVDRECDIEKSCGKCPYMMPTKEPILKAYDMAIKALSQEPTEKPITVGEMEREYEKSKALFHKIVECDDAISRKAVEEITWEEPSYTDALNVLSEVRDKVRALPPVTQKSGKWITKPHVYGVTYCSECDFELKIDDTNYCPNCGARMVEPQESEDKE